MSNTRLYEITSRSISPFPSVNPTDLLQGLRGGALLSSPLRQECVTRRFSNPLSITIPSLLVLVPFGSRCGSATSERKERLTRGMRAPRLNAARNLSPVVSFRSFEILLPPPSLFSTFSTLASSPRVIYRSMSERIRRISRERAATATTRRGEGVAGHDR